MVRCALVGVVGRLVEVEEEEYYWGGVDERRAAVKCVLRGVFLWWIDGGGVTWAGSATSAL